LSKRKRALPVQRLVLASSSPYRRELFARLGIPFESAAPDIDECPLRGEAPSETALRLAREKAIAIERRFPEALIVGSDQVADLGGRSLGKPLTHENAVRQLQACSGQTVVFHTGICLLDTATNASQTAVALNRVRFRSLTSDQIERYLARERPYDCTGSAKADAYGIVLIESFEGADPNALVGLPLILLVDMLRRAGIELP
jgi:septum formation protein